MPFYSCLYFLPSFFIVGYLKLIYGVVDYVFELVNIHWWLNLIAHSLAIWHKSIAILKSAFMYNAMVCTSCENNDQAKQCLDFSKIIAISGLKKVTTRVFFASTFFILFFSWLFNWNKIMCSNCVPLLKYFTFIFSSYIGSRISSKVEILVEDNLISGAIENFRPINLSFLLC